VSDDDARRNRSTMVKLGFQLQEVFDLCVDGALVSIQYGSAITGAPGQPVEKGVLLASFTVQRPTKDQAIIGTPSPYANKIEHGVGKYAPLTLKSKQGGFHSVKLTAAGMKRILANAVRRVKAGEP
jgi:hypothetical protein